MSRIWSGAFNLVLASTSPTRRRLLEAAGLPFEVVAPRIDERAIEAGLGAASPPELAAGLARAKALGARAPGALVVGADQVLSVEGRVVHKSATREEALQTLARLSGRTHTLTSAFALSRNGEIVVADIETAHLTMRPFDAATLELYLDIAGPSVLGSVGVYQWEGLGAHLFERVVGDHTTILGLPMLKMLAALRRLGALGL